MSVIKAKFADLSTDAAIARLKADMRYDRETGDFIRLVSRGQMRAGAKVGSVSRHGYIKVRIDGSTLLAHRLAWLYEYGEWPALEVDHINGVRSDNRILNLRLASRIKNAQNRRTAASSNKTAMLLGVTKHRCGKWQAALSLNNKKLYIGLFDSPEAAHAAYLERKRELHEGCTI